MNPGCSPMLASLTLSFARAISYLSCASLTCSLDSALDARLSNISSMRVSLSSISLRTADARL